MSVRVLIADDQDLVRAGFRMILEAQPDIEVVAEAADGREAVTKARHLRPDVCLLDIRMPEMDGIEATTALAGPEVTDPLKVVIITTFDLDEYVRDALEAGATGFLLKDAGPELLVEAIHAATHGDSLISPSITTRLLRDLVPSGARNRRQLPDLTDREAEALEAVAQGWTNAEIADRLHVSLSTAKSHVATLMAKLGARNRVELAIWWYEGRRP